MHADPGQGCDTGIPIDPPGIVDLESNGLYEGDTLFISFNGSFSGYHGSDPIPVTYLIGVFSSTSELLPINETYRVPGAINSGEDYTTSQTHFTHENTDIPEDFRVTPSTGFSIEVPLNATYLFICMHDSYYPDNTAPGPIFVTIKSVDVSPPSVGTPVLSPTRDNVQPNQNVTVAVNVTDLETGVKNVTLIYSLDNGTTWENPETISLNATSNLYEGTIPGQPMGTEVRFKIVAFDNAENNVTKDGTTSDYTYVVVPEFPSMFILPLFIVATLLATIFYKRRPAQSHKP